MRVKIGLNETKLGIVAPSWFADTMRNTIGQRETEMALMAEQVFQEAASIGLVDEIVDGNEVEGTARRKSMSSWVFQYMQDESRCACVRRRFVAF